MKKLLVSLFIGLTVFLSFAPYLKPIKAQTWYNQTFQEWYGKVYDPSNPSEIFGERYTAAQVQWIVYGLGSFIINTAVGPQNAGILQCFISNTADITNCISQMPNLFSTSIQRQNVVTNITPKKQSLLSLVFASDRPISGINYIKEKFQKLNFASVAHAQSQKVGIGFNSLEPIQDMWRAFRDVAFGLFVLVAIIFAFMIMFRVKLSPQTVVSVQSALPKITVALILVTFSYAIAGFLIDLMYVVIGVVSIIGAPIVQLSAPHVFNFLTLGQPFTIGIQLGMFGLFVLYIIFFTLCFFVISIPMFGIGFIGLTPFLSSVVLIILLVVAIFNGLKILWSLMKAFAMIILLTIFAPIQIVLGTVVPNVGFGAWFKSFLASLSVFIVTGALMLFSFIFMFKAANVTFSGDTLDVVLRILLGGIAANVVNGGAWPPLLGNTGTGALLLGVSFVLFTLIPKANEIVQGFITGRPFAYGTAIGEAFGPVKGAWGMTGAPLVEGVQREGSRRRADAFLDWFKQKTARKSEGEKK